MKLQSWSLWNYILQFLSIVCVAYRFFRAISVDGVGDQSTSQETTKQSSIGPDDTFNLSRRQLRSTSVQRTTRTVPRLPLSGKPKLIRSYGRSKEDLTCKLNDYLCLSDSSVGVLSANITTTYSVTPISSNQPRRMSHFWILHDFLFVNNLKQIILFWIM